MSLTEQPTHTRRTNFTRTTSFAATERDNHRCHLCNMTHILTKCQRFLAMNPAHRYRAALDARLCLNCLRDGHRARDCSSQYKCRHCNLAHHTMLHSHIAPADLLAKGGFELRKWTSNHLPVLSGLSAELIATRSSLQLVPNETVKTFGISWKPESDELCFDSNVGVDGATSTMRSILSTIAKMYDPLGLIAPIIVRAKMLIQELWLLKSGWDDPVPHLIYNKWKAIQGDWQSLAEFKTNRYVLLPDSKIELHTFVDASEDAYGACIYARCKNAKGEARISLLASKSRVAPLKRLTLPRLELSAAVLAAHLHHRVKKAMQIVPVESFFWSDSTIASPPNTWKTFVANRVAEVQHYSHPRQWRHVPGRSNPADLISRGMSATAFKQNPLWSSGPDWLAHPASHWPSSNPKPIDDVDLETRQVSATVVCAQTHPWFDVSSSFLRLVRIFAHCLRFVHNTRHKTRSQRLLPHTATTKTITPDNNNILIGRMVILMDESLPTTRWPLARVIETHPGEDNIVRVVTLKTAKGIVTRPITKTHLVLQPEELTDWKTPDNGHRMNLWIPTIWYY
uniref:CCHC-type domain-containing protein n=1 Tax=Anopheles dirus TaxID=7168 RepID=A0A182NGJ0_9DIPT